MKKIFAIALAGALGLPSLAHAITLECNNCTPEQVYEVAWSNLSWAGAPPGYVVDLANGTVAKFANIAEIPDHSNPEPGLYEPNIISIPVEPQVTSFVHDLSVLTNRNTLVITDTTGLAALRAGAAKSAAKAAADDRTPDNAYENLMRPDLEEKIRKMVRRDTQNIEFRFAAFLAVSTSISHFDADMFPTVVIFKFRDGSRAAYRYRWKYHAWIRVPRQSIDKLGNVVPEKKEEVFAGQPYEFGDPATPEPSVDWFRRLTESFGVPVIDMRPGLGGGGIVCVDGACYIQAQ